MCVLVMVYFNCSDEAYAMVCLENNVDKWLGKISNNGSIPVKSRIKSKYTEGRYGRKWHTKGLLQFCQLADFCKKRRLYPKKTRN